VEVENSVLVEVEISVLVEVKNSVMVEVENSVLEEVENSVLVEVENSTSIGPYTHHTLKTFDRSVLVQTRIDIPSYAPDRSKNISSTAHSITKPLLLQFAYSKILRSSCAPLRTSI